MNPGADYKWHDWYAWKPTKLTKGVKEGMRAYAWLETIERKAYSVGPHKHWDYKKKEGGLEERL